MAADRGCHGWTRGDKPVGAQQNVNILAQIVDRVADGVSVPAVQAVQSQSVAWKWAAGEVERRTCAATSQTSVIVSMQPYVCSKSRASAVLSDSVKLS